MFCVCALRVAQQYTLLIFISDSHGACLLREKTVELKVELLSVPFVCDSGKFCEF